MNTRIVMIASAGILAIPGVIFTFLPAEFSEYFNLGTNSFVQLLLQIMGSLYLAFAVLNWMAKGSLIGGIYHRPIAMGNFTHFLMGAITLVKANLSGLDHPFIWWLLAATYGLFAFLFGYILFNHPLKEKQA